MRGARAGGETCPGTWAKKPPARRARGASGRGRRPLGRPLVLLLVLGLPPALPAPVPLAAVSALAAPPVPAPVPARVALGLAVPVPAPAAAPLAVGAALLLPPGALPGARLLRPALLPQLLRLVAHLLIAQVQLPLEVCLVVGLLPGQAADPAHLAYVLPRRLVGVPRLEVLQVLLQLARLSSEPLAPLDVPLFGGLLCELEAILCLLLQLLRCALQVNRDAGFDARGRSLLLLPRDARIRL
mmetsp:Transcript_20213/g.54209  ORF Transcript_20213/g.54209 Transcript_20213/m.54209 type:complete len:242 (-) Transcript_20213:377-1102(-)